MKFKSFFHSGLVQKLLEGFLSCLACYILIASVMLFLHPQVRLYFFSISSFWIQILVLLLNNLIVAVSEEWVFRGYLFHTMREKMPMTATVLIVSFIFSLVHPMNDLGSWTFVFHFMLGIALALLLVFRKSIWVAIGFHWCWNVATEFFFQSDSLPSFFSLSTSAGEVMPIIASFILLVYIVMILFSNKRQLKQSNSPSYRQA